MKITHEIRNLHGTAAGPQAGAQPAGGTAPEQPVAPLRPLGQGREQAPAALS